MRKVSLLLGVILIPAMLAACGGASVTGEGTLQSAGDVIAGNVAVRPSTAVHLRPGEVVDVRSGTATVQLPSGSRLELRSGSVIRFNGGPTLAGGDLLAEGSTRAPVRVVTGIGTVLVRGAARFTQDLALTVASYRGLVSVDTTRTFNVPALEQATIASVSLAPPPVPFDLDPADSWDQRFLGTAIELTSQLDGQSRYVTANAPANDVAFYRRNLAPLATVASFSAGLLRSVTPTGLSPPAGDGLVAAAVALASPGSFAQRWNEIFSLRSQGAQWGIVVLDEHADPAMVLRLVGSAVSTAALVSSPPVQVALAAPVTVPKQPPAAPKIASASPTTTTAPRRPTSHPGPTSTTTSTTPPTTLLPPVVTPLTPALNPVEGIVHSLLGGS